MNRIRSVLVFFVSAAIFNVLVAWACILWSPYTSHVEPSDKPVDDGWPAMIAGPYGKQGYWFTRSGIGVWECVPSGARGSESGFAYWHGRGTPSYFRGGWPMWSLQSTVRSHHDLARWNLPAKEIFHRGFQTRLLPAWLYAQQGRRLPLVPIWFGFAVNTLMYFMTFVALKLFWRSTAASLKKSFKR